jgi:hypothetical protein
LYRYDADDDWADFDEEEDFDFKVGLYKLNAVDP